MNKEAQNIRKTKPTSAKEQGGTDHKKDNIKE